MVSFEIFVKAMPPSLSELKVLPSFCFAFKIPDHRAVTSTYIVDCRQIHNRPNRLEVRHRLYNKSSLDAKSPLEKIWVPPQPIHQVTLDFCIFDKIPLFRDLWVGQWRGRHLEQCHFLPLQMTGSNFGLVD